MGIKLDISVETPLSDDDRDILAGISVMVLAIANRPDLADQPHMQDEDGADPFDDGPAECGRFDEDGGVCVREAGHSGRHKYRPLALGLSGNGLEN